jgi:hypothetical protein
MLKNAVANTNDGTKEYVKTMREQADQLALQSGIEVPKIYDAYAKLANITGSAKDAIAAMPAAINLSIATGKDLATSAMLVGRAYDLGTNVMRRYGIVLSENLKGQAALDAINNKFAGAAAAQMKTLDGQTKALKVSTEELANTLGSFLIPALKTLVDDWLIPAAKYWKQFFDQIHAGLLEKERVDATKMAAHEIASLEKQTSDEVTKAWKDGDTNRIAALRDHLAKREKEINDSLKRTLAMLSADGNPESDFNKNQGAGKNKSEEDTAAAAERKKKAQEEEKRRIGEIKKSWEETTATVSKYGKQIGEALGSGNAQKAQKQFFVSMLDAAFDTFVNIIKFNMGKDIAVQNYTNLPVDVAQIGSLEAIHGFADAAINKSGAAEGVYDWRGKEPLITTLGYGESIIPKSMTEAMQNGDVSGSKGGDVHIHYDIKAIDGADVERFMTEKGLPAIARIQRTKRGGLLTKSNGEPNFG